MRVTVIGAGLAGCEAAWQAARREVSVTLIDMKPEKKTPAHTQDSLCELVCSNSLRADGLANGAGLLKEEMRRMDSLIMRCADETRVPAGGALAVDREGFSQRVTRAVASHPNITLTLSREITQIPDGIVVIASGPLTSDPLFEAISSLTGAEYLHFFDAAAPIVAAGSIDRDITYRAARYGKGGADYINCPMDREQYDAFWEALTTAEEAPVKDFELNVFEGCMPVEVMAKRGRETLLFGPLKPVGLPRPDGTGLPHAVVQLRQDDAAGTLYNLVGFQTHLKFPEQKRVFSMIPGLENAQFVRYGVMHRNTYLNSPALLTPSYRLAASDRIFFAGQITGVEGYVESAASGLAAGISAARLALGQDEFVFSPLTAHGALANYICTASSKNFQPMNINFGLLPPLDTRIKSKQERYLAVSERALGHLPEGV